LNVKKRERNKKKKKKTMKKIAPTGIRNQESTTSSIKVQRDRTSPPRFDSTKKSHKCVYTAIFITKVKIIMPGFSSIFKETLLALVRDLFPFSSKVIKRFIIV
jgi:hypothetical protein